MSDLLLTAAEVDIEAAAEKKRPKITLVAYTGGVMRVPGWGDVAIELRGLELPEQVPLLSDHDGRVAAVVGHGQPETKGGRLLVSGVVSGAGEAAEQVVKMAKAGFAFQASVGVEPIEHVRIGKGEKVTVNGRTLSAAGGFALVKRGRLREVSIVAVGADGDTSVGIAAQRKTTMTETEIRAAERERLASIDAAIGDLRGEAVDALRAQAVNEEITVTELRAGLLEHERAAARLAMIRASRPTIGSLHAAPEPAQGDILAAAAMMHTGHAKIAEAALGAGACNRADGLRVRSFVDLCAACLHAEGRDVPRNSAQVVTAAFSTNSLPVALGTAAEKIVLQTYTEAPASWRGFAQESDLQDFRTAYAIRPSFVGQLEPVAHDGEIKHGSLGEETTALKLETYAELLRVSRQALINDDGQVFAQTAPALGKAARRALSDAVYRAILANTGNHFSVGNGNLLTSNALGVESLAAAIAAMVSQRTAEGVDLDIRPRVLLVPPELDELGRMLLTSEAMTRYVSETVDRAPEGNPFFGRLELAVEPRLSNTARFSGASDSTWYLFAAPADAGAHVVYLNGQRTPIVETFDGGPETLGLTWRIYFDFGSALGDFRAGVKSTA